MARIDPSAVYAEYADLRRPDEYGFVVDVIFVGWRT